MDHLPWDLAVKLPRTSAALREGIVDEYKASLIAAECVNLTPAEARAAEDILFALPGIETMTWWQIRDRIARAVIEVNPDAARQHREQAAKTRRVEARGEGSGNAMIAGRELPPEAVLAMDQAISARARQLRKLGVKGGINELRAIAFMERWDAVDPFAPAYTGDTAGGPPWDRANEEHRFKLELVDADGYPVLVPSAEGGEVALTIEGQFEIGRPPGVKPGSALPFPMALNLPPQPIPPGGRYEWRLSVDGDTHEDWRLVFSTRRDPEA